LCFCLVNNNNDNKRIPLYLTQSRNNYEVTLQLNKGTGKAQT